MEVIWLQAIHWMNPGFGKWEGFEQKAPCFLTRNPVTPKTSHTHFVLPCLFQSSQQHRQNPLRWQSARICSPKSEEIKKLVLCVCKSLNHASPNRGTQMPETIRGTTSHLSCKSAWIWIWWIWFIYVILQLHHPLNSDLSPTCLPAKRHEPSSSRLCFLKAVVRSFSTHETIPRCHSSHCPWAPSENTNPKVANYAMKKNTPKNMVHLKMAPWNGRFLLEKPSF